MRLQPTTMLGHLQRQVMSQRMELAVLRERETELHNAVAWLATENERLSAALAEAQLARFLAHEEQGPTSAGARS